MCQALEGHSQTEDTGGVVATGGRGLGVPQVFLRTECTIQLSKHKASTLTRSAPVFLPNEKPTFTEPPSIAGSVRPCQNNQQNEAKQTARQQTQALIYCPLQTGGWLARSSDA